MPNPKKTIEVSTHLNNCAFHTLIPYLMAFVNPTQKKETDYHFAEVKPTTNNINVFKKTKGYGYFLESFADYYQCANVKEVEKDLIWLCQSHSHPLDLQVLLGPVLRMTLEKVLLNHSNHAKMIKESFWNLLQDCNRRFNSEVPRQFQQNGQFVIEWLDNLRLDSNHEFDELFIPNKDIIATYLMSSETTDKSRFINQYGDKAFKQYVSYQCDVNQCAFVSVQQLEMLCHSFHFNYSVSGYQKPQKSAQLAFKPLLTVALSNKTQAHWEIIASHASQWDFKKDTAPLSKFRYFYDQLQSLMSTKIPISHIRLLQNTFREEIKECLLTRKAFEQKIYTVLPVNDWSHNSGLEPFVNILVQSIMQNQSTNTQKTKRSNIQSTQGFHDFLEHFRGRYKLDSDLSHQQISEKLRWLLTIYPHPKEHLMIIGPVLRSILNQTEIVPSALTVLEVVRLGHSFQLDLDIYSQHENDARISVFHKIFSHKTDVDSFGLIELSYDNKCFYQISKDEIEGYKEKAIKQGSINHAFAQAENLDIPLRSRLKALQEQLTEVCRTGFPYINSARGSSAKVQRTQSLNATSSTILNDIISSIQKDDADSLLGLIKAKKISVNQVISNQAHTLNATVAGNARGWTLLHYAVYFGAKECVAELISLKGNWKKKAQWEVTDSRYKAQLPRKKYNISSLDLAACLNQRDILSFILNQTRSNIEKPLVQTAYGYACDFHSASALYAFLGFPFVKHSEKAIEAAITQGDLFLLNALLERGANIPKQYQQAEKILLHSYELIKNNHSQEQTAASNALYNFLSLTQHAKVISNPKQLNVAFKLTSKSSQVIEQAVKCGASEWVHSIVLFQNEFAYLYKLGELQQKSIHTYFGMIVEPIAKLACAAIKQNNTALLNHCFTTRVEFLVYPGKYNPMHCALKSAQYEQLRKHYHAFNLQARSPIRLVDNFKKCENAALDEYDRTVRFRIDRQEIKKKIENQIQKARWYELPKLYIERTGFALKQGKIAIADSLHLKAKHNSHVFNNPIFKYGSPVLQLLPTVGTLATAGPIRFCLDVSKVIAYRNLSYAINRLSSYCGNYVQYAESFANHAIGLAIMPQYYIASTLVSNAIYYGCMYSGLDRFESLEALAQLCGNQICYRYTNGNSSEILFDERYFMRLNRNLSEVIGEKATSWVAPAVYHLEYTNQQLNRMIASPGEMLKPYFSASTLPSLAEYLDGFHMSLDELPFAESVKTTAEALQSVQSYVSDFYKKRQLLEEQLFNYIEESALDQFGDSTFKAERLHAIQSFRTNCISVATQELVDDIETTSKNLAEAKETLKHANEQLTAYQKKPSSDQNAQNLASLKATVTDAQDVVSNLQNEVDVSKNRLTEKQGILKEAKEKEEALFKQTEGYRYYEEWQSKVFEAKHGEFDNNLSGAQKDALKQAEQEAFSKSRYYNSDIINQAAELWKESIHAFFEAHKNNFLDTTNIPNTINNIINNAFNLYLGQPNDRNNIAQFCADEIIRYKYPFYPEVGNAAVIEAERQRYFQKITNDTIDGYNKHQDRVERRLYNYIIAKITDTDVKKVHKYHRWEYLVKGPTNEILGKTIGWVPFPDFTGNGTPPKGTGAVGLQFNANRNSANLKLTVNNQPVFTFYDSGKSTGYSLVLPSQKEVSNRIQNKPVVLSSTNTSVEAAAPQSEAFISDENTSGFSLENPYIQAIIEEQRDILFGLSKQQDSESKNADCQKEVVEPENQTIPQKQAETNVAFLMQLQYGFRYLKGDRSTEILEWQKNNRKNSPKKVAFYEGAQNATETARHIRLGIFDAAKEFAGAIYELLNTTGDYIESVVPMENTSLMDKVKGYQIGLPLAAAKAVQVLGIFIGEEAARKIMNEELATTKYIRDSINQFVTNFDKMDENERVREVSRLISSFAMPGVFAKGISASVRVGEHVVKGMGQVVEQVSIHTYHLRPSTIAQRQKLAAQAGVSPSILSQFDTILAKGAEPRYSFRESTLHQSKSQSYTPGHKAQTQLNHPNINAQWFDTVSAYFTPIEKLTIPEDKALSFMGGKYSSYILKEDSLFWRAGDSDEWLGQFFSKMKPVSEIQARIDRAIMPIWPKGGTSILEKAYCVKIPKGAAIHVGLTAPQGGMFLGGTQQIYIEAPWTIKGAALVNEKYLNEGMVWNQKARKAKK